MYNIAVLHHALAERSTSFDIAMQSISHSLWASGNKINNAPYLTDLFCSGNKGTC
jgi:hypothetical protein